MDRVPSVLPFDASRKEKSERDNSTYDYKEIAREVLARIDQRLADIERDAPPQASEAQPEEVGDDSAGETETESETMNPDEQSAVMRLARLGLFGLLLSAGFVAAIAWSWSHIDTAKRLATQLSSRPVPTSTAPEEKPPALAETVTPPVPKVVQSVTVQPVAVQAAPAPQSASDNDRPSMNDRPSVAAVTPELAELMRKVDRDIAGLAQAVTDLRLAQQQVGENNAKASQEIKSTLDQLARTIVRAEQAEQAVQKLPAQPPRPAAPTPRTTRRFAPAYMSPYDAEARYLR
jgi:hypothetical protein